MRRPKIVALLGPLIAAIAITPAGRAAPVPRACALLSPAVVRSSVKTPRLRAKEGLTQQSQGASGIKGTTAICTYSNGTTPVATLITFTFRKPGQASREFSAEIKAASAGGIKPRPLKGPWARADALGSGQVYALKGSTIVNFQLSARHP